MRRPSQPTAPLLFLALLIGWLPFMGPLATPAQSSGQPNIILIITDDMRVDDLAAMPRTRALLVARGMTFSNTFVTTPSCCPSRSSILRGQYTHNHGVLRSSGEMGGFDRFHELGRETSTVATWLQAAGYRTALIGKYLNEYPQGVEATYVPPGWDEWAAATKEDYIGFELNENGSLVRYRKHGGDYSTDVFAAKAEDFVQRTAATGQPFFLYLAPRAPHAPQEAAPRYADAYPGAMAPRGPAFNEADVSDKPGWVATGAPLTDVEIRAIDDEYRLRLQTLLAVDDLVVAIQTALVASGIAGETYIVFTSDNGYDLGDHRQLLGKGTPYEGSIKVPLVVRGPDVKAGATEDRLVHLADLAPTFAALAGVMAPDFVDGRSILPLLQGTRVDAWRHALLVEYYRLGRGETQGDTFGRPEDEKQPSYRVLVTHELRYIEYDDGERELYDLTRDPDELDNLAQGAMSGDLAPASELAPLSAALMALSHCAGSTCLTAEDTPIG
jgi:N-acetylglucosamine-6-sulfatase